MAVDDPLVYLPLLSEKHLPHGLAGDDAVAYCDPHDLVAVATDAHDVIVYRINGQVAFNVKRKDDEVKITAVSWKPDGSLLGVGWTDGTYSLHSGENGRLVSQGSVRDGGKEKLWKLDLSPDLGDDGDDVEGPVVSRIGWMLHRPNPGPLDGKGLERGISATGDWSTAGAEGLDDDLFGNGLEDDTGANPLSKLIRTITTLDVTNVLPRLSAITSHGLHSGPEGSKFASQAATDSLFEPSADPTSEEIDSLLICSNDGRVQVLQDDSVKIGVCSVASCSLMQASNARSSLHAVLGRQEDGNLVSNFIDLPLETLGGPLTHVVSVNTKRMQTLLAYVIQAVRCIRHDFTTGIQFQNRLLNNLNAELEEKQEGGAVSNLYHLAMTGDFSSIMTEWLVDIVKEVNHKRLDQALNAMYTHIQNHIFIHILPALDRLSITATTLRGHAKFHGGSTRFDVAPSLFTKILDGVDTLRLVAQKMQLIVMTEHKQFRAFSKWLKVMVEVGVAGPGSKSAMETEEREVPSLDYPPLLAYIKDTMTTSQLAQFLAQRADMQGACSKDDFFNTDFVLQMGYERSIEALERLDKLKNGRLQDSKRVDDGDALVNLLAISVYLSGNVRLAIESITHWQSRMLSEPTCLPLDCDPGAAVLDMQMTVPKSKGQGHSVTKVLLSLAESKSKVALHLLPFSPHSDKTNASEIKMFDMDIGHDVLDGKLYGEDSCLLLVQDSTVSTSYILRLTWPPADKGGVRSDDVQKSILHVFAPEPGFQPKRIVVGGRRGKMVCLVISNTGRQWKALDLDAQRDSFGDLEMDIDQLMADV